MAGAGRSARSWLPVALIVAGLVLVGLAAVRLMSDEDSSATPEPATAAPTTTTGPTTTTTAPASSGTATYEAACRDELLVEVSAPYTDPGLVEVSGIAVDPEGVAWVMNDSGDRPRIYGLRRDGTVQTVDVEGADAVDWEDIAVQRTGTGTYLWIADTGGNTFDRDTMQLYRTPVPEPAAASVVATRFEVTFDDGPHDIEAVFVEPDGSLALLTKEPGRSRIYRVVVLESGEATVHHVGEFSVGDGVNTVVTSADLTHDGTAVVLRTYGSVFVVPVDPGQAIPLALADTDRRCRARPPIELQGEAIAFLPDGSGYVTMGEGENPYLTTVTVLEPAVADG